MECAKDGSMMGVSMVTGLTLILCTAMVIKDSVKTFHKYWKRRKSSSDTSSWMKRLLTTMRSWIKNFLMSFIFNIKTYLFSILILQWTEKISCIVSTNSNMLFEKWLSETSNWVTESMPWLKKIQCTSSGLYSRMGNVLTENLLNFNKTFLLLILENCWYIPVMPNISLSIKTRTHPPWMTTTCIIRSF